MIFILEDSTTVRDQRPLIREVSLYSHTLEGPLTFRTLKGFESLVVLS